MESDKKGFSYKIQWIWKIVRHGGFLLGVRNRLASIGIDFMPYYWLLEEAEPLEAPKLRDNADDYQVSYFGHDEIDIILNRVKGLGHKDMKKYLNEGQTCIGIKKGEDIVAYMFIQTGNVHFRNKTFELANNEAYLKDMYTFESYRGKNMAPFLRYNGYELLREKGIDTKYSISEYFNKPTIRFKRKLNSKHLALFLSIRLFKKFTWNFKLRQYSREVHKLSQVKV